MMRIGENVRCYVVSISTTLEDPIIFGPYTERKARELAERFNERIDPSDFDGEYIQATAMRIDNPQSVRRMLHEFGQ